VAATAPGQYDGGGGVSLARGGYVKAIWTSGVKIPSDPPRNANSNGQVLYFPISGWPDARGQGDYVL